MTTTTETRGSTVIDRVRKIWGELDYAQRRMLEIRTGVPARERPRNRVDVKELEALFEQETRRVHA